MRIACLTDTARIGGAERYLATCVAGACDAGHEVVVLAPQSDVLEFLEAAHPRARARRVAGDGYHGTTGLERARRLAGAFPALVRVLRDERPDVLHVNNGGWPGSDLCRIGSWAGAAARVPRRLMTVNSMPWPREDSQPQLQTAVDVVSWRALHQVSAPADIVGVALVATRGLPARQFRLVRYGVAAPGGDGAAAAELRARLAPKGRLLVGMVTASRSREKGFEPFVEALARTREQVHAVIVGPHPGEPFERHLAELGLTGRVTLEGPRTQVASHYHAIDCLVLPSIAREAMPLVILEAAAASRPSIASRLSGVPEAIEDGETGVLVEPGDVSALAEALDATAADPDQLRRMGTAARRRWEELYSNEALMTAIVAFYEGRSNTMHRYDENQG
jgi:glycosyltransferase involved in cell wall biosynthesis